MQGLGTWLLALATPLARQVLVALGIGVVTFTGVDAALGAALDAVRANLGAIEANVAAVLAMAGFFTAVSIVAGGLSAGVSMMLLKRFAKL